MAKVPITNELYLDTDEIDAGRVVLRCVGVASFSLYAKEMVAVIARLEEAAGEMGISTAQAELAKALRGLLWVIEAMREEKPLAPGYQERVEAARQALAKVQQ